MGEGIAFIRQSALNPKPRIVWVCFQRLVDRFAIVSVPIGIIGLLQESQFAFADGKPRPLAIAHSFFQFFCAFEGSARRRNVMQTDERIGQAEVGHAQVWIQTQCLVEGTRGFDPNVGMHIGKPLVVE